MPIGPIFPDPCFAAKYLAIETWNRIAFARTIPGTKIFETTITQNILFNILYQQKMYGGLNEITILESTDEYKNGSDILLSIQLDTDKYVEFAIQSKILYHTSRYLRSGNYRAMNHRVGSKQQVDILIDYADDNDMIPLYLLYNFINGFRSTTAYCGTRNPKQHGCTIVDANYIKRNFISAGRVPTFAQLHPGNAVPWCILFCDHRKSFDDIIKALKLPSTIDQGKFYKTSDTIHDRAGWSVIDLDIEIDMRQDVEDDKAQIDFIEVPEPSYKLIETFPGFSNQKEYRYEFHPGFKIIIERSNRRTTK